MADPPQPADPQDGAGRGAGGRRGIRALVLVIGAVVVVGIGFVAGLLGRSALSDLVDLPGTETVDRSQPAVLLAVRDLAELRAASGQYSTVLDIEQDVPFIPSSLLGERTLFVALGTVDATVDLADVAEGAVQVDADGSVRLRLPAAVLDAPRLDPDGSYVYDQDRGVLNRVGDAITGDVPDTQALYQQAAEELAAAAAASDLADRAEANTRSVLTAMLASLGHTDVHITFDGPVTSPSTGR